MKSVTDLLYAFIRKYKTEERNYPVQAMESDDIREIDLEELVDDLIPICHALIQKLDSLECSIEDID